MSLNFNFRNLRGMGEEECRAYLHELVDFIVDESYGYYIDHGNAGSRLMDGRLEENYGVVLKAVFHVEKVFDNEKGWIEQGWN